MKIKILLMFLLLGVPLFAAQYETPDCCFASDDCCSRQWLVEGNIGYFYPFSKPLREVISGGVDYQLQLTYKWNRCFGVFASGDFFYKSGHSTGSHSGTSIWIVPLTIGLRASIDFWRCNDQVLEGYCLLGPRWYFVHAHNSSDYVNHRNNAQGFGGVGGVGLNYFIGQFSINTFVNASFGNVRAHSSRENVQTPNTQVGSLVAGGGIGWRF